MINMGAQVLGDLLWVAMDPSVPLCEESAHEFAQYVETHGVPKIWTESQLKRMQTDKTILMDKRGYAIQYSSGVLGRQGWYYVGCDEPSEYDEIDFPLVTLFQTGNARGTLVSSPVSGPF